MRGLTYDGASVRLDTALPNPTAQPGEALIRLVKAAISRLDLEIARSFKDFRGALGQQFVGVVESVNGAGERAPAGTLVGKRVVGSPTTACGACDMCVAGLGGGGTGGGHCRNRTILGLHGRSGCLAERFTLPVKNLVVVPDSVDNDHAVFACELALALQGTSRLTIVGKPYITVLGDGSSALLAAQVMSKLNASVRLVGWNAQRLEVCEKWGIKHRLADDVGRRADQDIVVDCAGESGPQGLELAMQLVRPRGKIVLASLAAAASAADLSALVLNELEVIGSSFGPIGEAVSMLARREVDVVSLISRRMSLSDGPAILKTAAQPQVVKVLVEH